jgi:hypothetical protein
MLLHNHLVLRKRGLYVLKQPSFSKNRPNVATINFSVGWRFGVTLTVWKAVCAILWRIFSSNKRAPANRKKELIVPVYKPSFEE